MRIPARAILISLLTLAACGGKAAEPAQPASAASSTGEAMTMCVDTMTKARTCTDQFIPALVDVRAKHDNPAGIAEAVKADRAKVISEALAEWANDSKDEAIAKSCQMISEHATPEDVTLGKGCLAEADCAAYVTCITPMFEKHISK